MAGPLGQMMLVGATTPPGRIAAAIATAQSGDVAVEICNQVEFLIL